MNANIRKKLLVTEMDEIEKKYKSVQIHLRTQPPSPNQYQFDIILYDPYNDVLPKTLQFSIPQNYPFVPPYVFVKNIPYTKTIHCCEVPSVIKKLKKYYNENIISTECLYCSFITNQWTPVLGISDIIKEIEKIQSIKRQFKYEFAIERLSKINKLPLDLWNMISLFLYTPQFVHHPIINTPNK